MHIHNSIQAKLFLEYTHFENLTIKTTCQQENLLDIHHCLCSFQYSDYLNVSYQMFCLTGWVLITLPIALSFIFIEKTSGKILGIKVVYSMHFSLSFMFWVADTDSKVGLHIGVWWSFVPSNFVFKSSFV